jgi:V/A-type H+-transporting ATPase subunit D
MEKLALNKSSLKSQRDKLKTFERFLPSLDLKRQQLMVESKRAQGVLVSTRLAIEETIESIEGLLGLLGGTAMEMPDYVRVKNVSTGEENIVGVRLPVLEQVEFAVEEYSTLAKPFWVDALVDYLQEVGRLRIQEQVDAHRVSLLDEAVRKITQRVNLFEKVLIPNARENIHRIQIFLADAERAGVVRSKLVKAKRQRSAHAAEQT